jgi:hypothetical protein
LAVVGPHETHAPTIIDANAKSQISLAPMPLP